MSIHPRRIFPLMLIAPLWIAGWATIFLIALVYQLMTGHSIRPPHGSVG